MEGKAQVDIVAVIGADVKLRQAGRQFAGRCPFHDDHHPSMIIDPAKGLWTCFGCGKGGDVITYVQLRDGVDFREACATLGLDAGTGGRRRSSLSPPRAPRHDHDAPRWREPGDGAAPTWSAAATAFADWCAASLTGDASASEWLSMRGLPPHAAAAHGIGWNPGRRGRDLYRPRKAWGLPGVQGRQGRPKPLWIPRGHVIPVRRGPRVVALRIRRTDDGLAAFMPDMRYYEVPGSARVSLVLPPRRFQGAVWVLVENGLDACALHHLCGEVAGVVCTWSATMMPDRDTARLLLDAGRVLVAYDRDDAGERGMERIAAAIPQAERLEPPGPGKDIGEAIQHGQDVAAWLADALPAGMRRAAQSAGLLGGRGMDGHGRRLDAERDAERPAPGAGDACQEEGGVDGVSPARGDDHGGLPDRGVQGPLLVHDASLGDAALVRMTDGREYLVSADLSRRVAHERSGGVALHPRELDILARVAGAAGRDGVDAVMALRSLAGPGSMAVAWRDGQGSMTMEVAT